MSAKQKRLYLKGNFNRAENSFGKFLRDHGDDSDEEDANNYFDDVEKEWRNVKD